MNEKQNNKTPIPASGVMSKKDYIFMGFAIFLVLGFIAFIILLMLDLGPSTMTIVVWCALVFVYLGGGFMLLNYFFGNKKKKKSLLIGSIIVIVFASASVVFHALGWIV